MPFETRQHNEHDPMGAFSHLSLRIKLAISHPKRVATRHRKSTEKMLHGSVHTNGMVVRSGVIVFSYNLDISK